MENRGGKSPVMNPNNQLIEHIGLVAMVAAEGYLGRGHVEGSLNAPQSIIAPVGTEGSLLPSQIAYNELVKTKDFHIVPQAITAAMNQYPGMFNEKDFADLDMYFPIYKAAEEKYGVDWRLLWIIHDQETLCSSMKETTLVRDVSDYDQHGNRLERNILYGAMQRDKLSHPDSEVEEATNGLEKLAAIPTRTSDDWKEIAWAAKFIAQLLKEEHGNILNALKRYSATIPAIHRSQLYNFYRKNIPKAISQS